MSLFGPSRSKGITKEELPFVRGELVAGRGTERLSERQIDYLMELIEMAMDPDTQIEMRNHWEQASSAEVNDIEGKIADNDAFVFTPPQRARVHKILQKYIDVNRVKSFF